MPTAILNVTTVATNQNQKEQTINDAIVALEEASNALLPVDMVDGDTTVTTEVFTRAVVLRTINAPAAHVLTVPDTPRSFILVNACSYTVEVTNGVAATVEVAAGSKAHLISDDTLGILLVDGGILAARRLKFAYGSSELLGDGASLQYPVFLPDDVQFSADFATDMVVNVIEPPTSTAVLNVMKNSSVIGTISISTGGIVTKATTGGIAQTVLKTEKFDIVGPSPADGTLTLSVTLSPLIV